MYYFQTLQNKKKNAENLSFKVTASLVKCITISSSSEIRKSHLL